MTKFITPARIVHPKVVMWLRLMKVLSNLLWMPCPSNKQSLVENLIRRNSSSNTLGTYESPQFVLKMSDLKPFPMMSLTKNTSVHYARWSIRLVVMIHKIHCFLFSFANIDFAEIASRLWRGGRIVPYTIVKEKSWKISTGWRTSWKDNWEELLWGGQSIGVK